MQTSHLDSVAGESGQRNYIRDPVRHPSRLPYCRGWRSVSFDITTACVRLRGGWISSTEDPHQVRSQERSHAGRVLAFCMSTAWTLRGSPSCCPKYVEIRHSTTDSSVMESGLCLTACKNIRGGQSKNTFNFSWGGNTSMWTMSFSLNSVLENWLGREFLGPGKHSQDHREEFSMIFEENPKKISAVDFLVRPPARTCAGRKRSDPWSHQEDPHNMQEACTGPCQAPKENPSSTPLKTFMFKKKPSNGENCGTLWRLVSLTPGIPYAFPTWDLASTLSMTERKSWSFRTTQAA